MATKSVVDIKNQRIAVNPHWSFMFMMKAEWLSKIKFEKINWKIFIPVWMEPKIQVCFRKVNDYYMSLWAFVLDPGPVIASVSSELLLISFLASYIQETINVCNVQQKKIFFNYFRKILFIFIQDYKKTKKNILENPCWYIIFGIQNYFLV